MYTIIPTLRVTPRRRPRPAVATATAALAATTGAWHGARDGARDCPGAGARARLGSARCGGGPAKKQGVAMDGNGNRLSPGAKLRDVERL